MDERKNQPLRLVNFPGRLRAKLGKALPLRQRPRSEEASLKPILVVQTAFLGDVLLCGALLREIRRQRPQSSIVLMTRKGFGPLMKILGYADEVREIVKGDRASYAKLAQEFKSVSFEWIFCPHPSFRSKLFVAPLLAESKIGFRDLISFFFFSHSVPKGNVPDAIKQWSLITPVVPNLRSTWWSLQRLRWNQKGTHQLLPSAPTELSISCRSQLAALQPVTEISPRTWAIFPGSVWATKQWTETGFSELAQRMLRQGLQVIWLGGPEEKNICQRMADQNPGTRSIAGQTSLLESLVILSRCEGAIANDSGGQHMAAVAGLPILAIFGPTRLDSGFRPWASYAAVAERDDLFCRPCGPHGDQVCPRATHECMTGLSVAQVENVLGSLRREFQLNLAK